VFQFRKRIRIHRIHIALQDPDPAELFRCMELDPAPDPSKRLAKYKESRYGKVISKKNSVKKENDEYNRIRIRIH
jgi:hypothetical protein